MHEHIELELHHETLKKLEKLADKLGVTVDELIAQSIQELMYECKPANA